jgi:hypothetical protein
LFAIVIFLPATDLDLGLGADWPSLNLGLSILQTIETWRRHVRTQSKIASFAITSIRATDLEFRSQHVGLNFRV